MAISERKIKIVIDNYFKDECNVDMSIRQVFEKGFRLGIQKALLAQPEQRWIPIKVRPMDAEERKEWLKKIGYDIVGYDIKDEYAVIFDCLMPDDGQEIWVCSKCGNVWQDTCQIDEGIYLEENGDWLDIVAWMPFNKPEPWKEGEQK